MSTSHTSPRRAALSSDHTGDRRRNDHREEQLRLLLELLKKQDANGLESALRAHIYDALRVLNWIIDTNPENFG